MGQKKDLVVDVDSEHIEYAGDCGEVHILREQSHSGNVLKENVIKLKAAMYCAKIKDSKNTCEEHDKNGEINNQLTTDLQKALNDLDAEKTSRDNMTSGFAQCEFNERKSQLTSFLTSLNKPVGKRRRRLATMDRLLKEIRRA